MNFSEPPPLSTLSRRALAAALAAVFASPALAGRPLQTEDAGVLDRAECEIEAVIARQGHQDPTTRAGRGQVACGVGWQSQVGVSIGRTEADGAGVDATGLGGKTSLRPLTDDQTGVTIAWAFGFLRPRGGGLERDAGEVRAVVTHPFGQWFLHGNLGLLREADHRNRTVWGAAVERVGALGPVDAMFEFFGDGHEKAWANAGLRWNVIAEKLQLDASYGRRMDGGPGLLTVGMKLAF